MQFRLGKSWFSIGFSALALAQAPSAFAMSVTLQSSGNGSAAGGGTQTSVNFYFPGCGAAGSSGCTLNSTQDPQNAFTIINVAQDDHTTAFANANQFVFNVTTSQTTASPSPTPSSGQTTPYLVISVNGSNNVIQAVPIIGYQPGVGANPIQSCQGSGLCQALDTTGPGLLNYYYHAIPLNGGNAFQVALNLLAICNNFQTASNNTGVYAGTGTNGCTSNIFPVSTSTPATGTQPYVSLSLTFGIYNLPNAVCMPLTFNGTTVTAPSGAGCPGATSVSVGDTETVILNISNEGPASGTFSCNLPGSYYPGDGQITVNGANFTEPTGPANTAPDSLYQIALVAQLNGSESTPIGTIANAASIASNPTGGTINTRILAGSTQFVGGFNNSTQSNQQPYAVGYVGVDQYGFLFDNPVTYNATTAPTGCSYPNPLEVAQILGFLNASKCFIASAVFRKDASPVALLRRFRGEFLETFRFGRSFVHWYYAWSPRAADWLVVHPTLRFPILLVLIPLEILAWLILNPPVLTLLVMIGAMLIGFSVSAVRRRVQRQEEPRG